jgi:hypothetical protein
MMLFTDSDLPLNVLFLDHAIDLVLVLFLVTLNDHIELLYQWAVTCTLGEGKFLI